MQDPFRGRSTGGGLFAATYDTPHSIAHVPRTSRAQGLKKILGFYKWLIAFGL
jgi:hypothetical protein